MSDSASGTKVGLAILPYESATLLPRRLIEGLVPRPHPRTVVLGGRLGAYDYAGLLRPDVRGVIDVLALPTTRGIATVVCIFPADLGAASECPAVARSLRLSRVRPVPLDASTAFKARLPAELTILAREREIARSRVRDGDPRATRALAAAFHGASTALDRVAPGSAGPPSTVVRILAEQGTAYRRLATALDLGRRSAALRERARILSLEPELRRGVAQAR